MKVKIRGEDHLVMEAIERQVSHYSYYVGQIIYLGKLLKTSEWQSLSIPKGRSDNRKDCFRSQWINRVCNWRVSKKGVINYRWFSSASSRSFLFGRIEYEKI
ncbi:DUF1572 family protein [Viridibacillus sp. YIM B01967]|uniref:DUF1572 family protein n=2 Tax=Viridibacillus soli TaxID=2798301 RepID=A0ABS1HDG6_9BACL|nr:DUF1572 family protein [Viridibacillus soli]